MKKPTYWNALSLSLAVFVVSNIAWGQMRSGKLGVGASGSLYLFNSNISDGLMKAGGAVNLSYSAMEHLGIRAMFGAGQLGWKDATTGLSNTTTLLSGNLYLSYDMVPHGTFNPFLFVGGGASYIDPLSDVTKTYPGKNPLTLDKIALSGGGGLGFDYFFSEFFSMTLSGEFVMAATDKLDAQTIQKNVGTNESFTRVSLEFRYYFFDQEYITKLIQALQERYKKK